MQFRFRNIAFRSKSLGAICGTQPCVQGKPDCKVERRRITRVAFADATDKESKL